MGALWAGNLYRGFTVGNRFLRSLLEDFRAKDMSAARNRWSKESFGAETIRRIAHTWAIE